MNLPIVKDRYQCDQRHYVAPDNSQASSYQSQISTKTPPTFLPIGEGPPEGATHAGVAILQVLQGQVPDGDGLPVHLEAAPLVAGHRPRQHQQLGEQEHMQLLQEDAVTMVTTTGGQRSH